jgi:hypothetical protein
LGLLGAQACKAAKYSRILIPLLLSPDDHALTINFFIWPRGEKFCCVQVVILRTQISG